MTLDGLTQKVEDLEETCAGRHKRTGETLADQKIELTDLKAQIGRIGAEQRTTAHNLDLFRQVPFDATKAVLNLKVIGTLGASLVAGAFIIGASYWSLSSKLDLQQRSADDRVKLQESQDKIREMQMKQLGDAVADAKSTAADAKRQYELMRYDFQALKDQVQKKGR